MKLDPCPWCRQKPNVYLYTQETPSCASKHTEMVTVVCCHASLSCAKIDAEELWNWRSR